MVRSAVLGLAVPGNGLRLAERILVLGLATLAQIFFGWNLSIDALLVNDRMDATPGGLAHGRLFRPHRRQNHAAP